MRASVQQMCSSIKNKKDWAAELEKSALVTLVQLLLVNEKKKEINKKSGVVNWENQGEPWCNSATNANQFSF